MRLNGTVRSIAIVLTLAVDEAQLWSLAIVTEVPGTMDRETRNKEWGWVFTLQERKYFPFRPQDRYPQNVERTLVPRSRDYELSSSEGLTLLSVQGGSFIGPCS